MPAGANVTLSLGVAAGGAALVWFGIRNPEGGLSGAVQRLLAGQPVAGAPKPASNALDLLPAFYGGPSSPAGGPSSSATAASYGTSSGGNAALVAAASKYLGVPYVWGGTSPAGLDCSGLVVLAVRDAGGPPMPRVAAAQALQGSPVEVSQLAPGDLVAYGRPVWHIGIWSGSDLIHAPHPGAVVRHEALSSVCPNPGLITCRRLTLAGTAPRVLVA